jgi:hypothetical protein
MAMRQGETARREQVGGGDVGQDGEVVLGHVSQQTDALRLAANRRERRSGGHSFGQKGSFIANR